MKAAADGKGTDTMQALVDKLILLVCCFSVFITEKTFTHDVSPLLIAVIATCLLSYFDRASARLLLTAAFTLYGLAAPWSCLFLPLIYYDVFFSAEMWICFAGMLPLSLFLGSVHIQAVITLAILLLLSACLKYRTTAFIRLKTRYFELRDTMQEMALRLKKQNQHLLEHQDVEVTMATLGERNRIARDIHDNVGHLLSRALLQIGALLVVTKESRTKEALGNLKTTLSHAMDSIRTSVHDLHDDSIDLHVQLSDLVAGFTFCPLSFDYSVPHSPDRKLKYAFISIVKEALSNITRHSNATHAEIILREHPAFYQLIITDNGHVRHTPDGSGMGLQNIRDRIDAFHGLLNIETKTGFKLFITIPKGEK